MARPSEVEKAVKEIANAATELSKTSNRLLEVQKQFSDEFILHRQEATTQFGLIHTELQGMRKDFKEWFYPLFTKIVLGVLTIAGTSVGLKLFGVW